MKNSLTQNELQLIPKIRQQWIDQFFLLSQPNHQAIIESYQWLYTTSKLDKPFVIILQDPFACQIAINMLKLFQTQVGNQVRSQVNDQVRDQVRDQVGAQVGEQVRKQVRDQVSDQVGNQVGAQVRDQVRDQVWGQVMSQVGEQVRSQVRVQVSDQVMSQVSDQVMSQVGAQVRSQVESQVSKQVSKQVGAQVWAQVSKQVWKQVRDQVESQVSKQVGEQVREQVRKQVSEQVGAQVSKQVWKQVRDQVESQVSKQVESQVSVQVESQVSKQVESQVSNQVSDQVNNQIMNQVNNQIMYQVNNQIMNQFMKQVGDQFKTQYFHFGLYGDVSDYGWVAFYDYFTKIGIIDFPLFNEYKHHIKNTGFLSIQTENYCFVSQCPTFITRDLQNRLHNAERSAIMFEGGYELYYVHGIHFTVEEFNQYIINTPSYTELNAIPNVEKRTAVLIEKMEVILQNDPSVKMIAKDTEQTQLPDMRSKTLYRELYSFHYLGDERRAVLLYCHSVEKPNIHLVPVSCRTPKEAVDWMNYGMTSFELQT